MEKYFFYDKTKERSTINLKEPFGFIACVVKIATNFYSFQLIVVSNILLRRLWRLLPYYCLQ